jgi:adenosylcobinamide kinase / adenosylcobinamide-phosphate guanylyltransferase
MELLLLGTGSADGWPNPFCDCASCAALRSDGEVRGQTAVLVDDLLLLDCGPEAPRSAERLGRPLTGVRHVLLTHAHPDHTGPAALLWRGWTARHEVIDWVGPALAVDSSRDWAGSADPVRFHAVAPGDTLRLGGYVVRVLEAAHDDGAVLYDLTGPDGSRVLYGTDTGPLPAATLAALDGAGFDAVLLEETFGDVTDHGTGHLDLATFPRQLATLRRRGAVLPATRVVAVHLGHHNPPTERLAARLAAWGAEVLPDGASIRLGPGSPRPVPAPPRTTLLLGGARSGKSAEAERRLAASPAVTYVATGGAREGDADWAARVATHRARRPASWTTLETPDVAGALRAATTPVLVDCLTLWLTGVLDAAGAWDDAPGAEAAVEAAVDELLTAWQQATVPVVAVSNEVGSGVHPATPAGRRFRDALGRLNARVAGVADEVVLVVAGVPLTLKHPGGHP